MGAFNPSSPTVRGMEPRVKSYRKVRLDSPLRGVGARVNPGNVTMAADHVYLQRVEGNPGLAVEYVDTLVPTTTTTNYYPGTDAGEVITGWSNSSGTTEYTLLDDQYNTADYMYNTAALSKNATLDLRFRGSAAALTATTRVVAIAVKASVQLSTSTTNSYTVPARGVLNIGGTNYTGPIVRIPRNGLWDIVTLNTWALDPSTNLPWTITAANKLWSATDDEFGIRVGGKIAAGGFSASGLWLEVTTCTENRRGYYYSASPPQSGWTEVALTLIGGALTASTYYYRTIYPLSASPSAYFDVPVLKASVAKAASASASTGEHRQAYDLVLPSAGSPASTATTRGGECPAFLLQDTSGTPINAQSYPYAKTTSQLFYSGDTTDGYGASRGQQVTTAAATAYAGVNLSVGWQDPLRRPNRPLIINVRSGTTTDSGGTLHATAKVEPQDMATGAVQDVLAKFIAGSWTSGATTQYTLFLSSNATSGRGWTVPLIDSRSDNVTSGTTTAAEVQGTTVNGTTDSWITGGTADDRYDFPIALVSPPAAPAFTAAAYAGSGVLYPPGVTITITATALTTAFGGYRVYRRPTRGVAQAWSLIGEVTVPTGYTATNVEANHTSFTDVTAGWGVTGGQWIDGWDYSVTVLNSVTGLESVVGETTDLANVVTPSGHAWLVSNQAPYLNTPLRYAANLQSSPSDVQSTYQVAGRDMAVVRTRAELPSRTWAIDWHNDPDVGEDPARYVKAAAASGRALTLLTQTGDVVTGAVTPPGVNQPVGSPTIEVSGSLLETSRTPAVADANVYAGAKCNGTTQYAAITYATAHNPLTSAFSMVYAGSMSSSASAVAGCIAGAGARYAAFSGTGTANTNIFVVLGASATATTNLNMPTDGSRHVAIGTTSGTAQVAYLDGAVTGTGSTTHGSVDITTGSTGAHGFGAAGGLSFNASTIRAYAYYARVLTATEALAATRYLQGVPGYRMPYGAVFLFDLADARCWNGTATDLTDLSGNRYTSTLTASPTTVGIPYPLGDLEKF